MMLHIEMPALLAVLETLAESRRCDRPVIVGARGEVLAASFDARRRGVRPGLAMSCARRRCRGARILDAPAWSGVAVRRLLDRAFGPLYPRVEPVSDDEMFIELRRVQAQGVAYRAAQKLRWLIERRFPFTGTIGVGTEPYLARMATRLQEVGAARSQIVSLGARTSFHTSSRTGRIAVAVNSADARGRLATVRARR